MDESKDIHKVERIHYVCGFAACEIADDVGDGSLLLKLG